jgi:hypothetical protein
VESPLGRSKEKNTCSANPKKNISSSIAFKAPWQHHLGVSIEGYPPNGWFIMETPSKMEVPQ